MNNSCVPALRYHHFQESKAKLDHSLRIQNITTFPNQLSCCGISLSFGANTFEGVERRALRVSDAWEAKAFRKQNKMLISECSPKVTFKAKADDLILMNSQPKGGN